MHQEQWTAVDAFFCDVLLPPDAHLEAALHTSEEAGLPPHNVAPNQGKLLQLLAQIQGARTILELGTLGGYSTIWLARALPPNGRLVTLESNPKHAAIAHTNIVRAGLSHLVDLRMGHAVDSLQALATEGSPPFDFIFIDADKPNNPVYLTWALKLSRPGSLIIGDNVVRNGDVAHPDSPDANVVGVRRFLAMLADEPRVNATAIQTVGSKGYDGFVLARVIS